MFVRSLASWILPVISLYIMYVCIGAASFLIAVTESKSKGKGFILAQFQFVIERRVWWRSSQRQLLTSSGIRCRKQEQEELYPSRPSDCVCSLGRVPDTVTSQSCTTSCYRFKHRSIRRTFHMKPTDLYKQWL